MFVPLFLARVGCRDEARIYECFDPFKRCSLSAFAISHLDNLSIRQHLLPETPREPSCSFWCHFYETLFYGVGEHVEVELLCHGQATVDLLGEPPTILDSLTSGLAMVFRREHNHQSPYDNIRSNLCLYPCFAERLDKHGGGRGIFGLTFASSNLVAPPPASSKETNGEYERRTACVAFAECGTTS